MPFGEFKDFADCVGKNQDKDNPEAFCAATHKAITGKFPTEASEADILAAEQFSLSEFSKNLRGVKIFSIGTHTDSLGQTKTFTKTDMSAMIDAFANGTPPDVPIKFGHTSDEHNAKIADSLGIPKEVLMGEGAKSSGAARLGKVIGLRLNGGLMADLQLHDSVAGLVDDGLFNSVSAEIKHTEAGPVLSALSLLGAQRPALVGLHLEEPEADTAHYYSEAKFAQPDMSDVHVPSAIGAIPTAKQKKRPEDFDEQDSTVDRTIKSNILDAQGRVQRGEWTTRQAAEFLSGVETAVLSPNAPEAPSPETLGHLRLTVSALWEGRLFAEVEGIPMEGSIHIPGPEATASEGNPGDHKLWDVPFQDATRGHFIQATVSAASDITAKKVALRAVENFLLSSTGPLGSVVGATLGALWASRLIAGKPVLSRGIRGLLRWRFEESAAASTFGLGALQRTELLQGLPEFIARQVEKVLDEVTSGLITNAEGKDRFRNIATRLGDQVPEHTKRRLLGFIFEESPSSVSKFAGLLPETAMNRVQFVWDQIEKGNTSREEGVRQIESLVAQVKETVSVGAWQQIMAALQIIKAGFGGRKSPGEESILDKPPVDMMSEAIGRTTDAVLNGSITRNAAIRLLSALRQHPLDKLTATWYSSYQEGIMREQLITLLGLAEDSTDEAVITAVTGLKEKPITSFSETDFKSMQEELNKLRTNDLIHTYEESTRDLTTTVGTPKELATKLADIHVKAGEDVAKSLLSEWEAVHKAATEKGITTVVLSPREGAGETFMGAVAKYVEEHPETSQGDAIKLLQKNRPDLYAEHTTAVKSDERS